MSNAHRNAQHSLLLSVSEIPAVHLPLRQSWHKVKLDARIKQTEARTKPDLERMKAKNGIVQHTKSIGSIDRDKKAKVKGLCIWKNVAADCQTSVTMPHHVLTSSARNSALSLAAG